MSFFETSPIQQLFRKGSSGNYKAPEAKFKSDTPLRDAIIYLERKAEEMEQSLGMINVAHKTRTEIDEITQRQNERIAPFRRAIFELKKLVN